MSKSPLSPAPAEQHPDGTDSGVRASGTDSGVRASGTDSGVRASGTTRRDFMTLSAGAMGAVGADVPALARPEVDLSDVEQRQSKKVMWR